MPDKEYTIGDNSKKEASRRHGGGPFGGGHGTMSTGEKARDFKKTWGKLLSYCKPYLPMIVIALILAITATVFTLIGPNQLSKITNLIKDGISSTIDIEAIIKICVFLAILYGLSIIFSYIQGFIMATVTQKISKSMRTGISQKINKLPLKYFDSTSYGDVLSRVTNDIDTIGQTLNQSIGSLITAITLFFGSMIMMFVTDAYMALAAIGSTVIGFAVMMLIVTRSQKYFLRQQQALGEMNGHVEEIYAGHNIVKAYNGEAEAGLKFNNINEKLFESAWKSQFLSGLMMPLMSFIGNLGYVAVCVVGGAMALNGMISFGVIVAFMIYVRLFSQPLTQIAQTLNALQMTAAASERVFEFLEEKELENERDKVTTLKEVKGEVEFENARFGYNPNKMVIHNFSAHIKPGQKVAIVGPTGAGKTTIVNLLMRFYELDSGEIRIDGVPTSKLTRENVHNLFCMVLQDTWLFEGTIKENIVYSKQGITDDQIIAACKAANIDHFIRTLPDGYDTVLNDNANLSAGQKQLITIARAMIENTPLLILDEATSSVDTRTELLIQEAMDRLTVGRTSFVIAHRLSTIKNSDLILVMNEGDIIESGNHKELLSRNGFYAELYNSQFEQTAA
jgi:ATP-binding cassette subfamily B multidrug efflux pump